jgi:hypothetical protein
MVVALVALFVALGGSGYAAVKINGKNITNRSIAGKKLKRNTVGGKEVKESKLGRVPVAQNSNLLGGLAESAFLRAGAKAADADKLDGQDSTAFLGVAAKAADADKLDGRDSTSFLSSTVIRRFTQVSVGAGASTGSLVKDCESGEIATGGGIGKESPEAGDVVQQSDPHVNGSGVPIGWRGSFLNGAAATRTVSLQVICVTP